MEETKGENQNSSSSSWTTSKNPPFPPTPPSQQSEPIEPTADELKEQGNICVRNSNFSEALLHYTAAIKLSPKDAVLYSNRSLAFLKLQQYYNANKDADTVIQLNMTWAKGHFRKAEVLAAVGHYDSALLCYGRAMQLQPGDRSLLLAAQKAATYSSQQAEYEKRLPWVGAGIGIILGVILSLCDNLLTKNPTLKHPILMLLLVIGLAGFGYIVARCIRYYIRLKKGSLLEQPPDLLDDFKKQQQQQQQQDQNNEDDDIEALDGQNNSSNRVRYTKAQARMRFRKGKS